MTKAFKRRGLGVAFILTAVAALGMATATLATAAPSASTASANAPCTISTGRVIGAAQADHLGGVVIPAAEGIACTQTPPPPEPAFNGTPPLLFRGAAGCFAPPCFGGNVLMTASTGPLTVVPIFWDPAGYPMSDRKSVV